MTSSLKFNSFIEKKTSNIYNLFFKYLKKLEEGKKKQLVVFVWFYCKLQDTFPKYLRYLSQKM